jgi:hypothetical protein
LKSESIGQTEISDISSVIKLNYREHILCIACMGDNISVSQISVPGVMSVLAVLHKGD